MLWGQIVDLNINNSLGTGMIVVMKEEYLDKCNNLLKDEKTYMKLKRDPNNKYKDKFVDALQDLKERGVINKSCTEQLPNLNDSMASQRSKKLICHSDQL